MFLRKLICLPSVVLLLVATALSSPLPPQPPMVGIWDFDLDVTHLVARDGSVIKERRFFQWIIQFRQDGTKLTGDLIGGKGSRGEGVCAGAAIEGSINGRKVKFTVTYQGDCCKDEQEVFVGELGEDDKSLTGKLEPANVPRDTSCALAYADVKASKRRSLSRPH